MLPKDEDNWIRRTPNCTFEWAVNSEGSAYMKLPGIDATHFGHMRKLYPFKTSCPLNFCLFLLIFMLISIKKQIINGITMEKLFQCHIEMQWLSEPWLSFGKNSTSIVAKLFSSKENDLQKKRINLGRWKDIFDISLLFINSILIKCVKFSNQLKVFFHKLL